MKKIICLALSILLLAGLTLQTLPAALAAGPDAAASVPVSAPSEAAPAALPTEPGVQSGAITAPTPSTNTWEYGNYAAMPVYSTLIANADGSMTRVEYSDAKLICEFYNADGSFRSGKELSMELPLYGGVYAGKDYNFVVLGKRNEAESDTAEVIRIIRYDKNWNRKDSASLRGANTTIPFSAGSLRMVQAGDVLCVHTCHSMYTYSDGYRHQANLTLVLHIPTMKITDSRYEISNLSTGYSSHSFNQFILADGKDLLTLDHYEAASCGRGAMVFRRKNAAGARTLPAKAEYVKAFPFMAGSSNDTGASLGGFAALDGGSYLVVGNSVRLDATDPYAQRNVFVSVVKAADNLSDSQVKTVWLTAWADDSRKFVSTPQTVKLDGNRLLILWQEDETLRWTCVNANGDRICEVYTAYHAHRSNCTPILRGSEIVWYYTIGSAPYFCRIKLSELGSVSVTDCTNVNRRIFTDVPPDAWYSAPVAWALANGITAGTSMSSFSPNDNCVRAQIVTFLWRAAGFPAPGVQSCPFLDVNSGSYYSKPVLWAVGRGITGGTDATHFSPDKACTRAEAVTFLWRFAGSPEPAGGSSPFRDVEPDAFYAKAVRWATQEGITAGTSADTFSPMQLCTRAQIVTFLWRLLG